MIASDLINTLIPVLKPTDSIQDALDLMEDLRIHQLPVVDEASFLLGILEEDALHVYPNTDVLIGDIQVLAQDEKMVEANQHFYDVLKIANQFNLEMIPVIDEEKRFLGAIRLNDAINKLAKSYAVQQEGGILVLSMTQRDYSLSEISRLVESNNAKILSSLVEIDNDNPFKISVTIKIDQKDLSRIIATFERFNYQITAKFQTSELVGIDQSRLDLLLKYLEM